MIQDKPACENAQSDAHHPRGVTVDDRVKIAAAQLHVSCDRILQQETPEWIARLAEGDLTVRRPADFVSAQIPHAILDR